jgi:predicted outer membrane protein
MIYRLLGVMIACMVIWVGTPAHAYAEIDAHDRELLVRVRQAGLWEGPVSRQAEQRGSGQRVREVGRKLADDHDRLDAQVRDLASKVRVELPSEPTEEQRSWVDEITGAGGADFDRVYVNRTRAAHGSIFGLASQVRAATRDDAMRSFAQTAVDTVMRHMTLLESTGIAETTSLMVVADGGNDLDGGDVTLGVIMVGIAAAATFGVVRVLGSPGRRA